MEFRISLDLVMDIKSTCLLISYLNTRVLPIVLTFEYKVVINILRHSLISFKHVF